MILSKKSVNFLGSCASRASRRPNLRSPQRDRRSGTIRPDNGPDLGLSADRHRDRHDHRGRRRDGPRHGVARPGMARGTVAADGRAADGIVVVAATVVADGNAAAVAIVVVAAIVVADGSTIWAANWSWTSCCPCPWCWGGCRSWCPDRPYPWRPDARRPSPFRHPAVRADAPCHRRVGHRVDGLRRVDDQHQAGGPRPVAVDCDHQIDCSSCDHDRGQRRGGADCGASGSPCGVASPCRTGCNASD